MNSPKPPMLSIKTSMQSIASANPIDVTDHSLTPPPFLGDSMRSISNFVSSSEADILRIDTRDSEDYEYDSEHDAASPSDDFAAPLTSRKRFPVELLINYLHKHEKDAVFDLRAFEDLTSDVLSRADDIELLRCLKNHLWTGNRFHSTQEYPFEPDQVLQGLSNLYLKQMASKNSVSFRDLFGLGDTKGLESLFAFCPDILLKYLKTIPNFKDTKEVSKIDFKGCCMLVDISGFTAFSGQMCSRGVSGLDDLRKITDEFLGYYVHLIYTHGGDGKWHKIRVMIAHSHASSVLTNE